MLQDTFVVGGNNVPLTDRDLSETVKDARQQVQVLLANLADRDNLEAIFTTGFEKSTGDRAVADLLTNWSAGNFEDFPKIEVLTKGELGDALGAYAAETQTIYLSSEFLAASRGDVAAVTDVLLEEFGHWIDSRVNLEDSPGDEGAIFSALVRGEFLNNARLSVLQLENDIDSLTINQNPIWIEKAEPKTQTDTLNFEAHNISEWLGTPTLDGEIVLFEKKIPDPALDVSDRTGGLQFDASAQSNLKVSYIVEPGNLGETGFSYPISVETTIPQGLTNNETSSIQIGNRFELLPGSANFNPIDEGTKGFEVPNLGLKLVWDVNKFQFKDVVIDPPLFDPIEIPGLSREQAVGKAEIN